MKEARRCALCGGRLSVEILPHYKELQIGVAVDLVDTVEESTCKQCGEKEVSIPDFNGLLRAIAVARVKLPIKLNGEEIRFLRKTLELTAKELAAHISVREETISRWENNKEQISPPVEKLLRIYAAETLGAQTPGISIEEILHMPTLRFRDTRKKLSLSLRYKQIAHPNKSSGTSSSKKREFWEEIPLPDAA